VGTAASPSDAPSTGPDGATCFTAEPGVVGTIDHPVEPLAVVLRMFVGGGFVPPEIRFIESPVFTLYGNDVAIFQPSAQMEALTDPYPPFQCAQLSPEQVDELLGVALDEGGLAQAGDYYPNPNIVDVPSTTFGIDAGGITKCTVEASVRAGATSRPAPHSRRWRTCSPASPTRWRRSSPTRYRSMAAS
jgi:hypothetical protein